MNRRNDGSRCDPAVRGDLRATVRLEGMILNAPGAVYWKTSNDSSSAQRGISYQPLTAYY